MGMKHASEKSSFPRNGETCALADQSAAWSSEARDESVCERDQAETHKPRCQAYYRIIVWLAITVLFANYAAGRFSRKDEEKERK